MKNRFLCIFYNIYFQELFKPFGSIARIFLAKDKVTGQCKGFAFVNYYRKEDAAKAIATLNGYG